MPIIFSFSSHFSTMVILRQKWSPPISCIYKATLTISSGRKTYIGSTNNFKNRYSAHKNSFKTEKYKNATALSAYIWENDLIYIFNRHNNVFTIYYIILQIVNEDSLITNNNIIFHILSYFFLSISLSLSFSFKFYIRTLHQNILFIIPVSEPGYQIHSSYQCELFYPVNSVISLLL